MKFLFIVALFTFVAVQLTHAAPAPEEEKKEEVASESKVAEEATSPAAPAIVEARSSPEASPDAPVPAAAETVAPAA